MRLRQERLKLLPQPSQFAGALGEGLDLTLCCHKEPAAHPDPPVKSSKAEYYHFARRDDQGSIFKYVFKLKISSIFFHDDMIIIIGALSAERQRFPL